MSILRPSYKIQGSHFLAFISALSMSFVGPHHCLLFKIPAITDTLWALFWQQRLMNAALNEFQCRVINAEHFYVKVTSNTENMTCQSLYTSTITLFKKTCIHKNIYAAVSGPSFSKMLVIFLSC